MNNKSNKKNNLFMLIIFTDWFPETIHFKLNTWYHAKRRNWGKLKKSSSTSVS